jgi:hypothetical protein
MSRINILSSKSVSAGIRFKEINLAIITIGSKIQAD